MSLRYYKSNFVPDVDFSTDGRLSFTKEQHDGTFPLSARGLRRYAADDYDAMQQSKVDFPSLDSRRRFQKNPQGYRNGSVRSSSTGTASSRLQKNFDFNWLSDNSDQQTKISKFDMDNGHAHPNPQASFGSADSKIARKKLRDMDKLEIAQVSVDSTDVDEAPLVKEVVPITERPPAVYFVVVGVLLVLVGIVNTLLCPWHLYWCAIWTGALVIVLGGLGIIHAGCYFRPWQNWSYVIFGFLSSLASSVAIFLILVFLVPFLRHLPQLVYEGLEDVKEDTFFSSGEVDFTRWHPPVAESGATLVWLSLASPAVIFLLTLASLHATFGALMVLSNFWDCEYRTSGVCDHRHHPFWFNPVDYLRLSHACLVVGMACVVLSYQMEGRPPLYWMPVASPVMICTAAFGSFCHGKRPDNLSVGIVAVLFELLSLASLAITLALLTLGCVYDVAQVKGIIEENSLHNDPMFGIYVASLALYGTYVVLSFVICSYIIGIIVMHFRRLCSSESEA